ncbi:DUF6946 family protein [Thiocapsa bogorovii]|uniref:DUF6946 family protein n=1 Tax=Thiocapsa bogorovii TaxID=521689 RepID=UPI001E328F28|nr:hypothetical protein [Thiocapsa bogorovii]UHD17858.1 hypothetical protein LT988_07370 [Thiocapsa bogorovii]
MTRIFMPTSGPEDWKRFLAEPEKHWKTGNSAKALAYCWEESGDIPGEIRAVLARAPALAEIEALFCIPEHQVQIPGGSRPSQNDVWVLGRTSHGLVSIAVEGKVSESFGPTIAEWFKDPSVGKKRRLQFLCQELEIGFPPANGLRYQLFHRTASAIIEAKRFGAADAAMVVHTFSQNDDWFDDYAAFLAAVGVPAEINGVSTKRLGCGLRLHLGWVHGAEKWLRA